MPSRIETFRPVGTDPERVRRTYEQQASRRADRDFYKSARWRRLRAAKLLENPCCEECERAGLARPAAHVHHVKERRDFPELAFDYGNLEALCQPCHNSKRKSK